MMPLRHYVRRLPRTLMFWLFIMVVVAFSLRLAFPREGFDKLRHRRGPSRGGAPRPTASGSSTTRSTPSRLVDPNDVGVMFTASVGNEVAPTITADDNGAWVLLDDGDDPGPPRSGQRGDQRALSTSRRPWTAPAQDLAAGGGWIWVTSGASGLMAQVDAATGEIGQTVDVGQNVVQPQVVGDAVWVVRSDGLGGVRPRDRRGAAGSSRATDRRGYAVGEDADLAADRHRRRRRGTGTVVALGLARARRTGEVVVGGTRPPPIVLADGDQLVRDRQRRR